MSAVNYDTLACFSQDFNVFLIFASEILCNATFDCAINGWLKSF